jgi:hypothetical protein
MTTTLSPYLRHRHPSTSHSVHFRKICVGKPREQQQQRYHLESDKSVGREENKFVRHVTSEFLGIYNEISTFSAEAAEITTRRARASENYADGEHFRFCHFNLALSSSSSSSSTKDHFFW